MPTISKIRLTNVIYEQGQKRYHDELFIFDGFNGAILLENGGGKTVFIQTVLQAVIPHTNLAERKIKDTLYLEDGPAHIAIEWIINDKPRRYVVTAVSLYKRNNNLESLRYVYEYGLNDPYNIESIPFTEETSEGTTVASRKEMAEYYSYMASQYPIKAKTFPKSIRSFQQYIEDHYFIVRNEWESIVNINASEGSIEEFFEECKKTNELIDRLLIPSVELGIAGFTKHEFADIFENQRAQLKQYKKLREKIEENKLLQKELEKYVAQFKKLDDKEQQYNASRSIAKGYHTLLVETIESIQQALSQNEEQLKLYHNKLKQFHQKRHSVEILEQQNKLDVLKKEEQELHEQLENLEHRLQSWKHEYYSIQYAEKREKYSQEASNLDFYREQLAKLEQDENIEEINNQLEQVKGQLHYQFLNDKESLEHQLRDQQLKKRQLEDEQQALKKTAKEQQALIQQTNVEKAKTETKKNDAEEMMRKLKKQLVSNENENIHLLLSSWIDEVTTLDNENVELVQQIKKSTQTIEQEKVEAEQLQNRENEVKVSMAKVEQTIHQYEQAHQSLRSSLVQKFSQWGYIQSLYEKYETLHIQLEEKVQKTEKEREQALQKERLAKRYVDDYADQQQFFADPYIAKQMDQWNQFSHLETGTDYIQSMQEDFEVDLTAYPFWSTTLITTAQEKTMLVEKVSSIQHELTFPIFILSTSEAANMIKGVSNDQEVVVPVIWQSNLDDTYFANWNEEIQQQAKLKEQERKELEDEWNELRQYKSSFDTFFIQYPNETYLAEKNHFNELKHELQNISIQLKNVKEMMKINEELAKQYEVQHNENEKKMHYLQDVKIPNAKEYTQKEKEVSQLRTYLKSLFAQLEEENKKWNQTERHLEEVTDLLNDCQYEISKIKSAIHYEIEENTLFRAVKSFKMIANTIHRETLKQSYNHLTDQLKQIQTSRNSWEIQTKNSEKRMAELKEEQKRLLEQFESLDKDYNLPVQAGEYSSELLKKINQAENMIQKHHQKIQDAAVATKTVENKIDGLFKNYLENYQTRELEQFHEELSIVKNKLKEEEIELEKLHQFLENEQKRYQNEEKICSEGESIFNRYELVYKINDPNLNQGLLTEEQSNQFRYSMLNVIGQTVDTLQHEAQLVENERKNVDYAKEKLNSFCKTLHDPRLKKTAMEGVESKHTYKEIMEHQQLLENRILQTMQISEAAIRDYDTELQQFVTYIHEHLKIVRDNLLEIPKKTKVKIEDNWKPIYEFVIPDWDEESGKEKIRDYIDWILTSIESPQFLDVNGDEDAAKIRHFLEKSFETVPILRIVIGDHTMKVKCRKVESDSKISSNYYSWEMSNQWSGGEKWSKHMALYLGILNFIAEKSKRIESNVKRNRTVLLDNPFGKASSSHVLSPVFFIAEQLGFQIIALTAHAEGKFLNDYFPIVYSCRLSNIENSSKQVMTKEKQLKKAFFQDHAPEALERLGEIEQLSLFD